MLISTKMTEKQIRFGDRMYGLTLIAFGGGIALATRLDNILLDAFGALFVTEGLGDLMTGQHHYLSSSFINPILEKRKRRYLL